MTFLRVLAATAAIAALCAAPALTACSPQGDTRGSQAPAAAASPKSEATPKTEAAPPPPAGRGVQAQVDAINAARSASDARSEAGGNTTANTDAPDPALVKAQVYLARAGFSPGQVDGLQGTNLKHALAAFEQARGLSGGGELSPQVWDALTQAAGAPVAITYTVTAQDAAGPYYPPVGEDFVAASKLKHVGYVTPREMLAERFHMSEELLAALNPGADFGRAGTTLAVPDVGPLTLAKVDHVDVDKAHATVRAYDADDKLLAVFPATVGSTERPSPSGTHKVVGVSHDPDYTYDPKKLSWGPRAAGKLLVPSGPNNPVGAVWIDLNAPSYGLHGTPYPKEIGKTASHGCVRMTNWDAVLLASAVRPGVTVRFLHARA